MRSFGKRCARAPSSRHCTVKSATVTGETPKPVPLVSALAVELFASTMPDCRSRAAQQPTWPTKAAAMGGEWCRVAGVTRGGVTRGGERAVL